MPPLEMVHNVLTVQKCGVTSEAINTEVNAFMSQKKLTLLDKINVLKYILGRSVDYETIFFYTLNL